MAVAEDNDDDDDDVEASHDNEESTEQAPPRVRARAEVVRDGHRGLRVDGLLVRANEVGAAGAVVEDGGAAAPDARRGLAAL